MIFEKLVINGSIELTLPPDTDSTEKLDAFINQIKGMYGIKPEEMTRKTEGSTVLLNNNLGDKG